MSLTCLGCRLANGQESSEIVYEDELVTCLLDIDPFNEGHLLILPKKHYLDPDELDGLTGAAIMNVSSEMSTILKRVFSPDGITMIQNGGIFNDLRHYHMHVFPRYEGDGFAWIEPSETHNAKERLAETKLLIVKELTKKGQPE
ncbi:HIT domain-containing protein [Paenibacillus sp. LMG 31456]|uniref:HIT domain-containing protein n=1 Tax=Paenibacillus foliorum TaxID=2654974 RepID=A0A972K035_9BACL|nr:HIT family protein [Paenibacillus foliorum]NOU94236.1 HIT domain-containing protein [Paenibacillus foliorum]